MASIGKPGRAGVTDFVADIVGDEEERGRSFNLLSEMARS